VVDGPAPTITLAEAFERYFKAKARKRSLKEDERIAKHLKAEFGAQTRLSELTASRISAFKESRLAITKSRRGGPLSLASINRPLALLRALLRLACDEWEVLPAVPKVKLESVEHGRIRWLGQYSPDEKERLLTACQASKNADLLDLVTLALETGMRQGELLGLTWDRVELSRGVLRLDVSFRRRENTKSGKRREVPLSAIADALLARRATRQQGQGLVFGTKRWGAFRKPWEQAVEQSKLEDLHFHDCRHHYASWYMMDGGELLALSKILGHATLAMTMRYAHLSPGYVRTDAAKVEAARERRLASGSGENRAEQIEQLAASK
jgi:integrase